MRGLPRGDARQTGMEAMDPAKGYIGKPERSQIAQVAEAAIRMRSS